LPAERGEGSRVKKELSRSFDITKNTPDNLRRQFEQNGQQLGWDLTTAGSLQFQKELFDTAARTILDPVAYTTPASSELEQFYELLAKPAKTILGLSLSLSNPNLEQNKRKLLQILKEHYTKIEERLRRDYGKERGEQMMRILDLAAGQLARDLASESGKQSVDATAGAI